MPKACPVKELAPGKVLRLVTAPPIGAFHTEDDAIFAFNDTHAHQDAQLAEAMSGLMGSVSSSRLQVQPSNQMASTHSGQTAGRRAPSTNRQRKHHGH